MQILFCVSYTIYFNYNLILSLDVFLAFVSLETVVFDSIVSHFKNFIFFFEKKSRFSHIKAMNKNFFSLLNIYVYLLFSFFEGDGVFVLCVYVGVEMWK